MKAIGVSPRSREIRLLDHPEPSLTAPDEVKLRMLEIGVCGTDREVCAFHFGTPPVGSDYLVLGHECLGEVIETGPGVTRVRQGDLVVPSVRRPCPHATCAPCRHDRQDLCLTGDFTERGIRGRHGYMTELVVDLEKYMIPVPEALREVGVLVEPLTIAEKALARVWDVQARLPWASVGGQRLNQRAVVLGAGPVGLLGAMAILFRGFETTVYALESEDSPKAALARQIGASYVSAQRTSVPELAARVGQIDLVYEATGAAGSAFELLQELGTNGIYVFTGVPARQGTVPIDLDRLMHRLVLKNQTVLGTVNAGPEAFEAAVADLGRFIGKWPQAVRSLITGRFPVEAYREILLGKPAGVKNVFSFDRRS
jgi:threonine dehydrogenase-like Zn-dependent dehydrogenase